MTLLYVDIETYSSVDLKAAGVYRYRESPDFTVLMCAYAVNDGPVRLTFDLSDINFMLHDPSIVKVAHNAAFERVCLGGTNWLDTQAIAAEWGYPQKLDALAVWLGGEQKDSAGTRLINLFSKPNRAGRRTLPEEKPEQWQEFVDYCKQDVVTLRDVHKRLRGFHTETELAVYNVDQRINDRGLPIDRELALAAREAAETNAVAHELEMTALTDIANPNSVAQLSAWLKDSGLRLPNLAAETVETALARDDLTPTQRRVLELRKELALTASKKFDTALAAASADDRVRGAFGFFGAHTGRWTGRRLQPQNLPREQLASEADTDAAILDLKMGFGADSRTLKALVRALFVGPFTVVDYASIEARVLAWMAGETWALDAFRAGRDIYVETAERMGGLTRSQGKVAVLALGYNGSLNSLRAMGAAGNEAELRRLVDAWRGANVNIVNYWSAMERAFRYGGPVGEHVHIEVRDDGGREMWLPSGRALVYHDVRHEWHDSGYGRRMTPSFKDPKFNGTHTRTYGGRLTENATQAIARDLLAEALVRLDAAGYAIVGHVHDEVIVEGEDVPGVTAIMTEQPEWAVGLPIDAAGFTCRRYRKG